MTKLLKPHSMTSPATEEWLVEIDDGATEEEALAEIPASAPFGSTAMVLNSGLSVFMKNSQGQWVNIEGEGE